MLRVGAHVSISKGKRSLDEGTPPYEDLRNAIPRQTAIGGNCGQIFTHGPQSWGRGVEIDGEVGESFRDRSAEASIGPWVIHACYLVNLATPTADLREKSVASMQREIEAAETLGIEHVNVHLGAHTGAGVEDGLANAASALSELDVPEGVTILLESDAGSGTKLGDEFEHLARVREAADIDAAVCLDTAHMWAAGYDLSTPDAVDDTVREFDEVVGLEHLRCIHLNDSRHGRGSNRDEHEHVGEGEIGREGMRAVVNHEDWREVPFVLETPNEVSAGKSFAYDVETVRELRED
jgi:deoxyribonuclease-4